MRTNRIIGGKAASAYLTDLEKSAGISLAILNGVLKTHLIDPERLRASEFDAFMASRRQNLLDLIARAMQKPVSKPTIDGGITPFLSSFVIPGRRRK
jgi:hypothetical protein